MYILLKFWTLEPRKGFRPKILKCTNYWDWKFKVYILVRYVHFVVRYEPPKCINCFDYMHWYLH